MGSGNPGVTRLTPAERIRRHTVIAPTGCLEWTGKIQTRIDGSAGYGITSVCGRQRYAHRFAWETARGPIPAGLEVCHSCDNRRCVNVEHLFLGTRAQNADDADRKVRLARKLTATDADEIRRSGASSRALASRYGVARSMVWAIKTGRSWTSALAAQVEGGR